MKDSLEYLELSKNIGYHFEFYCGDISKNIDPGLYTRRPPLYAIFLLIASVFLTSKATIIIIQSILSIISILTVKNIFEAHFGQANKPLLYLFTFFTLSQFIYSNMLMSEIFVQFLIVLSIFTLHNSLKKKTYKHLFLFQITLILLLLTKPVFYLLIIPNIIITWLVAKKAQLKLGGLTSIIPILVVVLYSFWNFQRTGSYEFSSIQHVNIRNYNLKYFHINTYGEAYATKISREIYNTASEIPKYSDRIAFIKSESISYLEKDLFSYIVFHLKGSIKFFIDPGRYDVFKFFYPNSDRISEVGFLRHLNRNGIQGVFNFLKTQPYLIILLLLVIFAINGLKLIGFVCFWIKNIKTAKFTFWIMAFFIVFLAGISGPVSAARFMVPVFPFYLFFAIYGGDHLIQQFKAYRNKRSLSHK